MHDFFFPLFDGLLVAVRALGSKDDLLIPESWKRGLLVPKPISWWIRFLRPEPLGCPSCNRLPWRVTRNLPVGICQGQARVGGMYLDSAWRGGAWRLQGEGPPLPPCQLSICRLPRLALPPRSIPGCCNSCSTIHVSPCPFLTQSGW